MSNRENGFYLDTLAWGMAIVNGIGGHLLPLLTNSGDIQYVPGARQSAFMVPLGLWVPLVVFKQHGVGAVDAGGRPLPVVH